MSVFKNQKQKESKIEEGLTDKQISKVLEKKDEYNPFEWNPDRVVLMIFGGITIFGCFLSFLFLSINWVLVPMVCGAIQIFFGLTSFNPLRSLVEKIMDSREKKPQF